MKKSFFCLITCMLLVSLFACATTGENEKMHSSTYYEMSEALGIENPDDYWTKDWREIDTNHDGYITKEEMVDAYPKYGLDAFPYYDKDGDGKIHWGEWNSLIEKSKRK